MESINQKIQITFPKDIELYMKRDDLLHPIISGNKFRKLKYNIEEAKRLGFATLLTFGGAFSNHILAVAGAGAEYGFTTIGVIRGEELESKIHENPTLVKAQELGMQFYFVSRTAYRDKESLFFIANLQKIFGNFYLLPEGGTNELAIKGCEEILTNEDKQFFTHVVSAVGTGGTFSGIINSSNQKQQLIGFSSLKGAFLSDVIRNFVVKTNWDINDDYHFGGYGKVTDELIEFLNSFYNQTTIPLDPVYTGKMVFGVLDKIRNGYFPENSKILMIHTGGLQGIKGMNFALRNKNKEIINYDEN
ncbi:MULTISPECIES: 1-aminocyclopropane-1-carboxylate deaminase/D-cysteine desulfhydrase [unclassified Flavobacterium]|uniref:1-aminocyclopropane-1-carboxylate deaminase/D-cysteine desulfhydrase n=1 Tax=unclassified Flavobacterium TaxID=196869 RepID=UPI001291F5F0|nr:MULTISPECIES: pyridoxal-phosphate dependent enzyme [unclassified Flavobacterium]MQP51945.1 pyridoxal-phosphate dependent enzyme [Flavobacterium sp. LMO9]MQP61814.1 pyridoxal-phosphate dependent enzyme [Flavobacterium sp. LMO6]